MLRRGHEVAYKLNRLIVCKPLLLDVQIRMNDNVNLRLYARLLNRNDKLLNKNLQQLNMWWKNKSNEE
jgi:hypothetical protein